MTISYMLQLGDRAWVAVTEVEDVTIEGERAYIRTKSGITHLIGCDYGKSIWATVEALIARINLALSTIYGAKHEAGLAMATALETLDARLGRQAA